MMGAQVGWEVQEARLTDWDVPWWGTAMDLLAPAATGFVIARLLDGGKSSFDGIEPVFVDGPPIRVDGGDTATEVGDAVSAVGNRVAPGSASRLFVSQLAPLWIEGCDPMGQGRPQLGEDAPLPGHFTRCSGRRGSALP